MKLSEKSSKPPFNGITSEPSYPALMESFPSAEGPVQFAAFPRFPNVQEILDHQAGVAPNQLMQLTDTPRPASSPSIFQALLGGRVEVLVQDALDNPSRYDADVRAALLGMVSKKPEERTPADLHALNEATLDFAAFRSPRQAPAAAPKPAPVKKPQLMETETPYDNRAPQGEEPGGVMSSYWWL